MNGATPGRRRIGAALALVGGMLLALAAASPASAHNQVISSDPASGAILTTLPAAFRITTNENLLDLTGNGSAFAMRVQDATGRYYGDGCITVRNATMTTPAALGAAGAYTLSFQLISADGHPVSGTIPFTWQPPAGSTPAAASDAVPVCGQAAPTGSAAAAAPAAPPVATTSPTAASIPVADLLWIGGAVLVVLVAAGVAILIVSRRRPPAPPAG